MARNMIPPVPTPFLTQMEQLLGEDTPAFLCALNEPPALALRLNPIRRGAEAAAEAYIDGPVPWAANGRYLKQQEGSKPGSSIAHAAGAFYLQEASAMVSPTVLDAQPGESVLDLCAAPGGKSTQIAASMEGRGVLISNDPVSSRARALASNLERMGCCNAIVVNELPHKLAAQWPDRFDAVLVDAPCSGEGMFRRDPASREQWSPSSPSGCAKRQAEILDQAARLVRPGGRLIYSTCTFNRIENEGSVLNFLDRHSDFTPEDFRLPGAGPSQNGMLKLYPHKVRGDGHFVAKLRRAGKPTPPLHFGSRNSSPDPSIATLLQTLNREVCALPDLLCNMHLFLWGDCLYAQAQSGPSLDGIKVICPGLALLRVGRGHIEPSHALAMALPPECALRRFDLDEDRARAWLRGEAVPCDAEDGWTLALAQGLPLGWGKVSMGVLKNHLPKGLRKH